MIYNKPNQLIISRVLLLSGLRPEYIHCQGFFSMTRWIFEKEENNSFIFFSISWKFIHFFLNTFNSRLNFQSCLFSCFYLFLTSLELIRLFVCFSLRNYGRQILISLHRILTGSLSNYDTLNICWLVWNDSLVHSARSTEYRNKIHSVFPW